jgi:hypothetical protein
MTPTLFSFFFFQKIPNFFSSKINEELPSLFINFNFLPPPIFWRHNTQFSDSWHNAIHRNDTRNKDNEYNATHHKSTQHFITKHEDNEHNDT